MANPTTVRLTPEREERVKKMTVLYRTQAAVINKAIDWLWVHVGEGAERAWAAVQAERQEAGNEPA